MPDVASLEIQIGGNVDAAVKGFRTITEEAGKFSISLGDLKSKLAAYNSLQELTLDPKAYVKYGEKITQIERQIAERVSLTSKEFGNMNSQLRTVSRSSSSASNSLFALSGIVQDAPYGFRAIGNNITFFTQQMQYSIAQSGGFKAALKGLGAALIGPAGLTFAISAGVSLLTYFLSSSDKAEKAAKETADAVKTLADANLQGAQDAQKEAVNLNLLYGAATNVSKSMKERLAAVKELQNKYPSYFGNISKESVLAGKAADAYARLKDQIIATAKSRAAQELIEENSKKLLKIDQERADEETKRQQLQIKLAAAQNEASKAGLTNASASVLAAGATQSGGSAAAIALVKVRNLKNEVKESTQAIKGYNEEAKKYAAANERLAESVNASDLTNNIHSNPGTSNSTNSKDPSKTVREAAFAANQALASVRNNFRQFTQATSDGIANNLTPAFTEFKKNVQELGGAVDQNITVRMQRLGDSVSNGLVPGFEALFQAMFNGGNAAQALLNSIGSVIAEMLALAAAAAVAAAVVTLATGGANAATAEAASSSFASTFSTIFAGLSGLKLASGGIAYGPTQALIGEYAGAGSNPEVVAPLDKLKDLLGNSGGKEVRVVGEFRQRGSDLVAVINTQNKRTGRVN